MNIYYFYLRIRSDDEYIGTWSVRGGSRYVINVEGFRNKLGDQVSLTYTKDMEYKAEPGHFKVFVSSSSADVYETKFDLIK